MASSSGDGGGRPPNVSNHIVWSRRSEDRETTVKTQGAADVVNKCDNDLSSSISQDLSSGRDSRSQNGFVNCEKSESNSSKGSGRGGGHGKGHQLWETEDQLPRAVIHNRMAAAERASAARAGQSKADEEEHGSSEQATDESEETGERGSIEVSIGSAGHYDGTCKPCYFVSRSGCTKGKDCRYCHLPHSKSSRRPKPCKRSRERYRSIYRDIEADPNGLTELGDVETRLPTSVKKNEVLKNKLMDRLTGYREYLRSNGPGDQAIEEALPVFGARSDGQGHRRHIVAL